MEITTSILFRLWLAISICFCEKIQPPAIRTNMPKTLKLASFNIRFGWPQNPVHALGKQKGQDSDQEHPWYERRQGLVDQVVWEEPDIIGFQEVLNNQLGDLAHSLVSSYDHIGVGRDDGKTKGEAVPIFWRKDRVKLLDFQHFWLSDKPEVVGSIGWDAGQTRMATLAHFAFLTADGNHPPPVLDEAHATSFHTSLMEEEPERFFVLNTHYDDRGILARKKSSELIVAKLNDLMADKGHAYNKLVIVLGDLNSPATEDGYQVLTGHRYGAEPQPPKSEPSPITFLDSRHALVRRSSAALTQSNALDLSAPFGEHFTYTGFSLSSPQTLIDYVMLADNGAIQGGAFDKAPWRVGKYGVIPNYFGDGIWVSDHRMVTVTLRKS